MDTITLEPTTFVKTFSRADVKSRRTRPVTSFRTLTAVRWWAEKKLKRLAAGRGVAYRLPVFEVERDYARRAQFLYVLIEYALLPEGKHGWYIVPTGIGPTWPLELVND